ncbi:MAG: response regulator [Actinobacteria bacterium]|nr:response regulator [Actinomycetota bacterium]
MGGRGESKRILYIEDEPEMARMVTRMLEAEGHTVIEAERGTQGLESLYESFPHLVLLDLRMTVMSGYEFLEAMKSHSGLREIPVVCVTGLGGLDRILEAFMRGADGYLVKPIDLDLLTALIAFLTSRESLEAKTGLLLDLPGMREAARLVGYGVDSLEKAGVLLAVDEAGSEGCTLRQLGSRLGSLHEDLEKEVRELTAAGALRWEEAEGTLRLNLEGGWGEKHDEIRRLLKDKQLLEAFVNGLYTGVLAYALETGYYE